MAGSNYIIDRSTGLPVPPPSALAGEDPAPTQNQLAEQEAWLQALMGGGFMDTGSAGTRPRPRLNLPSASGPSFADERDAFLANERQWQEAMATLQGGGMSAALLNTPLGQELASMVSSPTGLTEEEMAARRMAINRTADNERNIALDNMNRSLQARGMTNSAVAQAARAGAKLSSSQARQQSLADLLGESQAVARQQQQFAIPQMQGLLGLATTSDQQRANMLASRQTPVFRGRASITNGGGQPQSLYGQRTAANRGPVQQAFNF